MMPAIMLTRRVEPRTAGRDARILDAGSRYAREDAMSSWIGSLKANNPGTIARGQFGAVAIPRLLALLKDRGIRASFAVPGHTAYAFPRQVEANPDLTGAHAIER